MAQAIKDFNVQPILPKQIIGTVPPVDYLMLGFTEDGLLYKKDENDNVTVLESTGIPKIALYNHLNNTYNHNTASWYTISKYLTAESGITGFSFNSTTGYIENLSSDPLMIELIINLSAYIDDTNLDYAEIGLFFDNSSMMNGVYKAYFDNGGNIAINRKFEIGGNQKLRIDLQLYGVGPIVGIDIVDFNCEVELKKW